MNRKQLGSAIQRLQSIYQSKNVSTLHDKIETCFGRLVLDECATLFKRFQAEDDARFSIRLQAFLKDTYDLVHGTFLFYTAMPTSEMTLLLCDLSTWVAQTTHQPIITILMPSIASDSLQEEYPDLINDDIDIRWILQTHILGEDGLHLVPVGLLTKLDLNPVQEPIGTPYTSPDRSDEREAYFVSPEELSRMGKYSELSNQLVAEKVRYFELQNNNNALYSELTILCKALVDNSVYGSGTELNAGNDVYPAIFHFGEFYKTLKKDNPILIQRLSTGLKQEIERILSLVSTRSTSDNAVERCIAIRRTQLMHAMSQSEALTNTEDLRVDIQQSVAKFEQLKIQLGVSLTQAAPSLFFSRHSLCSLNGRDPLTITASLLQNLNVLNILGVQNDTGLFGKLFGRVPTSPLEELKQLITPLPLELRTLFLTSMGNNLRPLIQSIQDFVFVENFSSQQQAALIFNEIIKPRLGTLLNSTKDFKAIRVYLSESEQSSILNDLKDRLPTIWFDVIHEIKIQQVTGRALSQLK